MNPFARLQQLAARASARTFAAHTSQNAWFPDSPDAQPATRAAYSIPIPDITTGPVRRAAGESLQSLERTEETITVLLPFCPPFQPARGRTTILIGTDRATAARWVIRECRQSAGTAELDCARIHDPEH